MLPYRSHPIGKLASAVLLLLLASLPVSLAQDESGFYSEGLEGVLNSAKPVSKLA